MAVILGKIKCWFCDEKGGIIHSVHDYGIYGEVGKRVFYHPECLEMVEMDPEKFGHKWADKAIQINELQKSQRKDFNGQIVENYQKKVDQLHQNHFEKMMPRK